MTKALATMLLILVGQAAQRIAPMDVVRLTNEARSKPLSVNAQLTAAAQRKADDMIRKRYFDHFHGSDTPWGFMRDAGYDYKAAAENLGRGYETAEEAQAAWMKSKEHRRNILGDFTDIGVAVRGDLIVVMFGRR